MDLTPQQITTLRADILASADMADIPNTWEGAYTIAHMYDQPSTSDFRVWRTFCRVVDLFEAINWANLTPQDVPDGTQTWVNRALACQGKQFNVQTMLAGRDSLDASKDNIRAGLQDALTNVPSGASGAMKSAGWAQVKIALQRTATRVEKLFAVGIGTQATPAKLVFEGALNPNDVYSARNQ